MLIYIISFLYNLMKVYGNYKAEQQQKKLMWIDVVFLKTFY